VLLMKTSTIVLLFPDLKKNVALKSFKTFGPMFYECKVVLKIF
jgi:hypothetical protein